MKGNLIADDDNEEEDSTNSGGARSKQSLYESLLPG